MSARSPSLSPSHSRTRLQPKDTMNCRPCPRGSGRPHFRQKPSEVPGGSPSKPVGSSKQQLGLCGTRLLKARNSIQLVTAANTKWECQPLWANTFLCLFCVHECACRLECTYIYKHLENRGHPHGSFLRLPSFGGQDLSLAWNLLRCLGWPASEP